jgi:hypothetical protein
LENNVRQFAPVRNGSAMAEYIANEDNMDAEQKSDGPGNKQVSGDGVNTDEFLEQNRKHGTSGLSWDEVAENDKKKNWRQITEMGEGD